MGDPSPNASQIQSYLDVMQSSVGLQNDRITELDAKNTELANKQNIQIDQLKEIEDKEKLLLTRSRMLQIAQDRNSYKKKIIYTLLAVIFLILILTIVLYVFFVRKMGRTPTANVSVNRR